MSDYKKGDPVIYVPGHANGDTKHSDCERGVVSSTNECVVFVKFDNNMCTMVTGDEDYTAQGCYRRDLVKR